MANNVSILFWIKANWINKKGVAPLMLGICYNKKLNDFSTDFSLDPNKRDSQNLVYSKI
ncbi:MAG: hypothetical protein ABI415_00110 [Flavitalea sp.]